ncbi:hypothetical protein [Natribacillus halophilus]|uniref:Uncharacterized protein n=1 Tax=Natribacillus halophilus TaxID=549003 RepID=A0A1G8SVM6_9BACI|nr:hypothetical protein [Natribacillus halophilus]SDJ32785.1 hypothetical protein SAMN04488123_13612 [Natribacillus halophilus]
MGASYFANHYFSIVVAFTVGIGILIVQSIIFLHRKNKQLKK